MGSYVVLDRSIFPSQDIRCTGKGTCAKPKVRKDVKMAPKFLKPKVPMPSNAVPESGKGDHVKEGGEPMEEGQDNVVPTGRVALCSCEGNPCSCGGFVCKSVGDDFVCPHEVSANENPERSVVAYTPPTSRGNLYNIINVQCFVGGRQCVLCKGECCPLVNRVVDALMEDGDINPDGVFLMSFSIMPFIHSYSRIQGMVLWP